jgi:hypothetical protein
VALRDLSGFVTWIDRQNPSDGLVSAVMLTLEGLGTEPWRSPSIPLEMLSLRPHYEVRETTVTLAGEGTPIQAAWILYRHTYATGDVDIIEVDEIPPPG